MHLIDRDVSFRGSTSIVGNSIPLAVGLGLSIRLQQTDQVSCVFFGEGAVETGAFYESVNFAILKNLPVLFVCENNLYSVYSPLHVRQPTGRENYQMVKGLGISSDYGDGNDILGVYEKTAQALGSIRQGNGPFFLEFFTYRWREHCGHLYDNDLGYRTESEFNEWQKLDPIRRFEDYLLNRAIATEAQIQAIKESQQAMVNDAFEFAEQSPFPESSIAYLNMYADTAVGE